MADESTNGSTSRTRRSSFAGQTFADLFGNGRASASRNSVEAGNSPPSQYTGPITSAAAQAQRRRLSLTTLGLGNTNGQSTPFNSLRGRQDSLGSGAGSIDECAVEDDASSKENGSPATPFARRVSFGARAMMDIRNGGQSSPGQQNGRSPPASFSNTSNDARGGSSTTSSGGTISARNVKGRGLSLVYPGERVLSVLFTC